MKKTIFILLCIFSAITFASCGGDEDEPGGSGSGSSSLKGTVWERYYDIFEDTYEFTGSGYTKRIKYELLGKNYNEVIDNGTYTRSKGELIFYSGMGSGVKSGTVSGNTLTVAGVKWDRR